MADHGQQNSQEPLTKREREVIQELAREIVSAAGLARDPQAEADEKRHREFIEGGREHWKAQVDFFKHVVAASGAALLAVTAVAGAFDPDSFATQLLGLAALLFGFSAFGGIYGALHSSNRLTYFSWGQGVSDRADADMLEALTENPSGWRAFCILCFVLGLTALIGVGWWNVGQFLSSGPVP